MLCACARAGDFIDTGAVHGQLINKRPERNPLKVVQTRQIMKDSLGEKVDKQYETFYTPITTVNMHLSIRLHHVDVFCVRSRGRSL